MGHYKIRCGVITNLSLFREQNHLQYLLLTKILLTKMPSLLEFRILFYFVSEEHAFNLDQLPYERNGH